MTKMIRILAVLALCVGSALPIFAGGSQELAVPDAEIELQELKSFSRNALGEDEVNEQEALTVKVEEAVELAKNYNLSLKTSDLDLLKKERAKDTVWNSFIPTLSVSSTLSRMNEAPSGFDFATMSSYELSPWNLSLGVNADLRLNIALFDGIRATRLNYRSGRISYQQAEKQLERDVRKSFYNLILMQKNRELFLQQIDAAEDRYRQAQVNYRNGLVPELSMLQAQVAWENLKPALEAMDLGYQQALGAFKMTLGLSQDSELAIEGEISVDPVSLDASQLIETYLSGRLDIQSLLLGLKNLDILHDSTVHQALTPSLSLGWSYDPSLNDPFGDTTSLFDGDDWQQQGGMFRLTLAMNLEGFLPGSKTQVALKDIENDTQTLQIQLMQAIEAAEMEIQNLVRSLNKSQSSMSSLKLNVDLADRAYRMAEEAYRAGSKELLEVENSEIELNKAQYELLKEKYNYVTGLLDLEYALNTGIESLKEGNNE